MRRVIRQPWYRRWGVWMGSSFVFGQGLSLSSSAGDSWLWVSVRVAILIVGLICVVAGWRQAVVVDDAGITTQRLARLENRRFRWHEIERAESEDGPARLRLKDGRTKPLFDWSFGDHDVVEELQGEIERHMVDGGAASSEHAG